MKKALSLLSLSAIALVGCNMTADTTMDSDTESSEQGMMTSSASVDSSSDASVMDSASSPQVMEANDNSEVLGMVQEWAPNIVWSASSAGTNDGDIMIDELHSIPSGAIQAQVATATLSETEFSTIFIGDGRMELDAMMTTVGWMVHPALDADGHVGTRWGYKREGEDGVQFLILSANVAPCMEETSTATMCGHYDATVTLTDALAEGDDL